MKKALAFDIGGTKIYSTIIDENGNIIFVRQYRHAARDFILEIPAGMIEKGEEPRSSAVKMKIRAKK